MKNFDDLFTAQGEYDKAAWAAKKQAERQSVYEQIDRYVADMAGDGKLLQTYLDVQARFDLYSVSNAILIANQMPNATRLADFDTWSGEHVHVKKDAESIVLLEPGKEYTRADGNVGVSCNVKKVFDLSQTNAPKTDVPPVSRDARLLLRALMSHAPCGFAISDTLPDGVNVSYQAEDDTILVRRGLDAAVLFRGLAQERAYAHLTNGDYDCKAPVFASYCVSYLLCKRNNVSVEGFAFDRLPENYSAMDPQAIRQELGVIRAVSGRISMDMSRCFAVQEKQQRFRDDAAR